MFHVLVDCYSLAAGEVGKRGGIVYGSQHRTLKAAARRLASLCHAKRPHAGDGGRVSFHNHNPDWRGFVSARRTTSGQGVAV